MKSKARYMRSKSCKEILGNSYDKYVSKYIAGFFTVFAKF